jgi:PIN domain nuclease of toxin-antitoxin system
VVDGFTLAAFCERARGAGRSGGETRTVSAISLWEAQMLHAKGRIAISTAFADWLEQAADEHMLGILPIDVPVVLALDSLPPSFHGDPADRIIVATARARSLPLATRDATIRRSRIATLWKA